MAGMSLQPPRLCTARLRLRPVEESDTAALFALHGNTRPALLGRAGLA